MPDKPLDKWVTIEEAAREVHAPSSLIEKWVKGGRVATRTDPVTHSLLVSFDDVEDAAEEEAFRRLSQRALAQEDKN
jgi:hypothetical protein